MRTNEITDSNLIEQYGMSPDKYAHFTSRWHYFVAKGHSQGLMKDIDPKRCALVVVDVQEECVDPDRFIDSVGKYDSELPRQYQKRLNEVVWPNLEKLITFFRSKEIQIIYTVFVVPNQDGVHPRLLPLAENEWVIYKPTTGVFHTTSLDSMLEDQQIDTLFFTGVVTSHCVSNSAHGAINLGYQVVVIEDACADCWPEHHEAILKVLSLTANVKKTDEVIADYPWKKWIFQGPLPA